MSSESAAKTRLSSGSRVFAALKHPVVLVVPALVVVLGLFLYPVATSFMQSFTDPEPGLQNYQWFFTSPAAMANFRNTFAMALLVTVLCLSLSYPFAYLMVVSSRRTRFILIAVVLVPYWTSVMVRTLAWIGILQQSGVANEVFGWFGLGPFELMRNRLGVVIAMTQILLPFMVFPLYSSMQSIDLRLLTAAQSLGASRSAAFTRVFLPLSAPGAISGSVLVFVQSLGFYLVPSLLGSPKEAMISQQIYNQVSSLLNWGRGGAISMLLLLATALIFGLAALLLRRLNRRLGSSGR